MKRWKILVDCALLCCLLSLVACRFDPFVFDDNSDETTAPATIAGFTPEQIQQIVDDIKNDRAVLPVSLSVPAYSFYRFDYSNVAGGHRGSTILSYDQAIASPAYGIETTARVLIFEAMKVRAGYSFDFFAFSDGLSKDRIGAVITAIAAQYSDTEFLLNSNQNIGSTTLVAQAVNELISGLPLPAQADFVPAVIASPAVDLNLRPDFSDLPVTTLTTLFLNEDLHEMYASMTVVGLANYSLFTSNVPAVSQPRPALRMHKTETEHNITRDYLVSLAPISATGSVMINPASPPVVIQGIASAHMEISSSGNSQTVVFTYSGDHAVSQILTAMSEKLMLAFTYRDEWDDNCEHSKRVELGPIAYLNRAGPQAFASESFSFTTPVTKLLCIVMADNQPIATFTAEQGVPATAEFSVPAGRVATLACYIVPPTAQTAEAYARTTLLAAFASETRPLDALETAAWEKACDASTSVVLSDIGRSIFVPTMFKTWFRPVGTYVYNTSPREFTPQVFRNLAAPTSPSIVFNMSKYSEEPRYAFSMTIGTAQVVAAPLVTGITSGAFNAPQTFSIQATGITSYEYSLDNGTTWNAYSGPVTLSAEGSYQVIARNTSNNLTSTPVSLTIDTTAPTAPTISGITSGIFTTSQTFTVTAAEPGGTLYYSLDGGLASAPYTGPVTISQTGPATCTAWQIDAASNVGQKAAPVSLTILPKAWRKTLGGPADESALYCVTVVGGGGVIVAGTTLSDQIPSSTSGTLANSDIWIARLDDGGNLIWSKRIGGSGSDNCSGLIALANEYVLAGDSTSMDGNLTGYSSDNDQHAMLMKFDGNGNVTSVVAGLHPGQAGAGLPVGTSDARGGIRNTSDGGCIMAGTCFDGSYRYAWAVKFNSALGQVWDVRITGNGPETLAYDVAQKADGNYLLCGFTNDKNGDFFTGTQPDGYSNDGFVAEISALGAILQTRCFGGSGYDSCTGVVPMPDGDFYVIGDTGSTDGFCPLPETRGDGDVMVFSVSADFATTSTPLCLGGSGYDSGLRGQLAADGGLLFTGQTSSTDGDVVGNHGSTADFWFGKVSSAGNLEWQKCFGGTADDFLSSFVSTADGGYLFSGYGMSTDGDLAGTGNQTGSNDFIIIREAGLPTP